MNSVRWSGTVGAPRPWRMGAPTLSLSGRAAGTELSGLVPVAVRSAATGVPTLMVDALVVRRYGAGLGQCGLSPARVRR